MEHDAIFFFSEGIDFEVQEPERVAAWLTRLAEEKGRDIETLNYIFLSDEALRNRLFPCTQQGIYMAHGAVAPLSGRPA